MKRSLTFLLPAARALVAAALVATALVATTGCANLQKSPGRCVGCCYDSCVVPIGASIAPSSPLPETVTARNGVLARAMAY